jgi:hypothetical protein
MSVSLTAIVSYPSKQRPLMMDNVPASTDPDAGPFLITSSRALMWVDRAFPSGFLRVAVRETGPAPLFRAMIEAIADRGSASGWGNVAPTTIAGIKKATDHLSYYGITDIELLHGKGFAIEGAQEISTTLVPWMPDGWGALVARDRSYVGTVYDFGEGHIGGVIHNASRGVAILR